MASQQAPLSRSTAEAHPRLSPAVVLMNLWVYPLLVAWTLLGIVLSPLAFGLIRLATGWRVDRIARQLIWVYGRVWQCLVFPFVRFELEGFDRQTAGPPGILVLNHLSFFDTYCKGAHPISDVTIVVRAWPFRRLFWYTLFMRLAGYLDVESDSWDCSLQQARRVLDRNGWLLFFPEGHRSRDGELQRFYTGAFKVAVETGRPVVPLCISGTDRLLPPGRLWLAPTRVKLRMLAPIDPADFPGETGPAELRKAVKARMAEALQQMRGVASSAA